MGFEGSGQFYPLLGGGVGLAFEHLKIFSVFGYVHKNLTVSMQVSVK